MHNSSIYLITDGEYYKIGRTSNSIKTRINAIQTSNPNKIILIHSATQLSSNQSMLEEANLHKHFAKYRGLGEWFMFTEEQVTECKQIMDLIYPEPYIEPINDMSTVHTVVHEAFLDINNLPKELYIDSSDELPEGHAWLEGVSRSYIAPNRALAIQRVHVNIEEYLKRYEGT